MNRTFAVLLTVALSVASAATPAPTAQTPKAQAPATAQATATLTISDVQFEGFSVFDSRQIAEALGSQVGIKAGGQVTPAALEEGRVRIAQTYAESGFPFSPEVKLKTAPDARGNTVVTYSVDESAPLSRVNVTGVTLIQPVQLQAIFKPLTDSRRLTASGYNAALAQISRAYTAAGYIFRPQDVEASLKGGVLSFAVTEAFVAAVDTSSLNLSRPVPLSTRTGQGMSATTLNDDARTLSNATGKPVVWQAEVGTRPGQVNVTFSPEGAAQGERIRAIVIQGNDHISSTDILKVMRLRQGDIATSQLAQQDFYAIQKLYDERGYALAATEDSLSFDNGILAFHLREARVGGYVLNWPTSKPLLDEKVVRHILPAPGTVIQRQQMRGAVSQLQSYDNIMFTGQDTRVDDPEHPEQLTFVLTFAERKHSLPVSAAATYDQNGVGGQLGFGTNNLMNSGQGLNLTLGANANDVGQRFSGSVNYSIPWINSNFLDFARHPTSLSLSLGSNAVGNNALYVKGSDGLPTSLDTGRQYTVRSTGFNATAARTLKPNLMASAGIAVSSSKYYLEPYKSGDSSSTTPANRATYQDDAAATVQLPLGATTVMPKLGLQYDTTDSVLAPSFGVRAQATLGYGMGRQSDGASLSWGQVEAGSSTYYGFGRTLDDGSKQEVIAGRVNAGTIVGTGGESNVFTVGTSVFDPAYEIRGQSSTLHGTSYLTSSAELRHNFGVKLGDYVSGVYGLAFVDAGDAWTSHNGDNPFGLKVAYGVGAQVNTSLLNVQLTYGQSSSGNGRFALRLGRFW